MIRVLLILLLAGIGGGLLLGIVGVNVIIDPFGSLKAKKLKQILIFSIIWERAWYIDQRGILSYDGIAYDSKSCSVRVQLMNFMMIWWFKHEHMGYAQNTPLNTRYVGNTLEH